MNMMNKCAKFHKDKIVQVVKKVKFNLPSAIELSETAMQICVQLCIETVCKRATSVAHLTNFSFEFFYETFTKDACLSDFFYIMVQSQKWPKTQIKGVLIWGGGGQDPSLRLF